MIAMMWGTQRGNGGDLDEHLTQLFDTVVVFLPESNQEHGGIVLLAAQGNAGQPCDQELLPGQVLQAGRGAIGFHGVTVFIHCE